jgi:hypothetical protein
VLRTGVVASDGLRLDVGAGDESGVFACGGTGGEVPVSTAIGVGAADSVDVVARGRADDAFPLLARPESISFRRELSTGVVSSSGGLRVGVGVGVGVDVDVGVDAGGGLGGVAGEASRGGVCDLTDHDVGVAAGDDVGIGVPDLTATELAAVALGGTADVGGCAGAGGELPLFAAGGESSGCVRLAITSIGGPSAVERFDGRTVVSAGLRLAAGAGEFTVVAGAAVSDLTATESAGVGGRVGAGGALPVLAEAVSGVGARAGGAVTGGPSAELRLEVDARVEVEVVGGGAARDGTSILARSESGVVVGATVGAVGCSETDRELSDLAGFESRGTVRAGATASGRASAGLRLGAAAGVELAAVAGAADPDLTATESAGVAITETAGAVAGGGVAILAGTESGNAVEETDDGVGCAETAGGFLGGMSSGACVRAGVTAAAVPSD